jgi:hypothetical protein
MTWLQMQWLSLFKESFGVVKIVSKEGGEIKDHPVCLDGYFEYANEEQFATSTKNLVTSTSEGHTE